VLALALVGGRVGASGVSGITPKIDASALCAREIAKAERELRIPRQLLYVIAQVESGRWSESAQRVVAWPWTVMAEGRGKYLPTKAAAIREVKRLRGRGVRNIDVGCLQINLMHHPDAFDTLEKAFDPATNVAYGARFLRSLQIKHDSWVKAVGSYHSKSPARHRSYRTKVLARWLKDRHELGATVQAAAATTATQAMKPATPLSELRFGQAGPVSPAEKS
jgi:soluble lytic murein transglycosylase-like protein